MVEALFDEADEVGGGDVVGVGGSGVVSDGGGVAGDDEEVAESEGVGGEEVALDAEEVASADGEVEGGLDADALLEDGADGPRAHAHAGHGAVRDIDDVGAGFGEEGGCGDEVVEAEAVWGVDLDGEDEASFAEFAGEFRGSVFGHEVG